MSKKIVKDKLSEKDLLEAYMYLSKAKEAIVQRKWDYRESFINTFEFFIKLIKIPKPEETNEKNNDDSKSEEPQRKRTKQTTTNKNTE